eukprot:1849745-Pleurochrysis_carterae.AAC.1
MPAIHLAQRPALHSWCRRRPVPQPPQSPPPPPPPPPPPCARVAPLSTTSRWSTRAPDAMRINETEGCYRDPACHIGGAISPSSHILLSF